MEKIYKMRTKQKRVFTEQERKNQNSPKYRQRKIAWRLRNREKRRAQRQRHYDKTKIIAEVTKRRPTGVPSRPWTEDECEAILTWDLCTEREIGKHFNRSVHAIQQKRYQLKKENQ